MASWSCSGVFSFFLVRQFYDLENVFSAFPFSVAKGDGSWQGQATTAFQTGAGDSFGRLPREVVMGSGRRVMLVNFDLGDTFGILPTGHDDIETVMLYRIGYLNGEDKSGTFLYRARAAFGL